MAAIRSIPPETATARDGEQGPLTELLLEGNVTVAQARALLERVKPLATAGGVVIVRCERLNYLDCAGTQVLLALNETLRRSGGGLKLVSASDSVYQTLRCAGLAEAF